MSYPVKPRVLLLSTKKIVESSWLAEINKWYPNQISYNYITGEFSAKERLERLKQQTDILAMNTEMITWYLENTIDNKKHYSKTMISRFNMVIIDESSLFKSYRSNRFKAIKNWCSKIEDVFILSATPTPNSIEDLWSQIYLLDGGERLGRNITAFRTDYATPIPMYNGQTRYEYSQKAVDYILTLVKDIVVSIPEPPKPLFPEPVIKKVLIKPDPNTAELLENFKNNSIINVNGSELVAYNKTQLMVKINQIASGCIYDHNTTQHINDSKFNALLYLLQNIQTPVLITYTYVFDKERLLTLPGAVLLDNTKAFEDWNNNKIKIGVLSPFSVAHGLNLQHSDCVDIIWYSPIWDTEKWQQTNARVCRRGQTHKVTIRVLILKNTFDDYAFDLVQEKFSMQYNNLKKLS